MTTPAQRAPTGRGVCACVTPGVTLGVTWHGRQHPVPLLQTHSSLRGGLWSGRRPATLDLFHSDLTWQALAVSGLEASALISLFNYCKSEEPQPMLMKPHQSAGGESEASMLQNNPPHEQSWHSARPPARPASQHACLPGCLSHSSGRFIRVVCPQAKPSCAARRKKPLWIPNETRCHSCSMVSAACLPLTSPIASQPLTTIQSMADQKFLRQN